MAKFFLTMFVFVGGLTVGISGLNNGVETLKTAHEVRAQQFNQILAGR